MLHLQEFFDLRYFIKIAYKGTNYHGWQYQPNAASVQETLNRALTVILNSEIDAMGAGRTDTGVHAKEMYAHFDFEGEIENTMVHKLNAYLPKDIVVYEIIPVHDEAHARFDARLRTYEYHLHNFKDAFDSETSWYNHQTLNLDLMNEASALLLTRTDFECFSKVNTEVNTFNCNIADARWTKEGSRLVFTISADRFLRNMVRAIVGTLVNVGLHKTTLAAFIQILESRDRNKAGFSAPAHGLYLTKITYDYINDQYSPDGSGILFPASLAGKR